MASEVIGAPGFGYQYVDVQVGAFSAVIRPAVGKEYLILAAGATGTGNCHVDITDVTNGAVVVAAANLAHLTRPLIISNSVWITLTSAAGASAVYASGIVLR